MLCYVHGTTYIDYRAYRCARKGLQRRVRAHSTPKRDSLRAAIILRRAEGIKQADVAKELGGGGDEDRGFTAFPSIYCLAAVLSGSIWVIVFPLPRSSTGPTELIVQFRTYSSRITFAAV